MVLGGLLRKRFQDAGLTVTESPVDVRPHMTFFRLSSSLAQETGSNPVDCNLLSTFSKRRFGEQFIDGIHLCSMTEPLRVDGFYLRLATACNNLVGASPRLPGILHNHLSALSSAGLVSKACTQCLNLEVANSVDVPDSALEPLLSAIEAAATNKLLLIMRGLPGNGSPSS